jgi:hypothetical protein
MFSIATVAGAGALILTALALAYSSYDVFFFCKKICG